MGPEVSTGLVRDLNPYLRSTSMGNEKIVQHLKCAYCLILGMALQACSVIEDRSGEISPNNADTRQPIELIVQGDYVVSMDDDNSVHRNAAVAVDNGVIIALGPIADINAKYRADQTLDGGNQIVMPGLINGHSHAAMTLLRGVADDLDLMDWLNNYIFPAEVEFVDPELVRIGTELACWEMIRGGTTTFVDMYYFPDVIADVVDDCGMRAMVSATVIGQKSPDADGASDSIAKGIAFAKRWKGKNSRITPILGPHSNYTLNAEQLRTTAQAARENGLAISIHMSESPFELQYSKDTYGKTSIEFFDSIGFLDGPVIGAHVVWPTESEIALLAARKVGVIHNPTSNMKIASGVSPVTAMLKAGVRVGLGTDGAASNNDLDMWEEMRLASLLQKVSGMDPKALSAATVLRMATRGGAEAVGLADQVGSIETGKRADIIQVSFDDVHFIPTYNVISHLVYVADEQDVSSVVVDGKLLMYDGEMLTIDTERVRREATRLAAKIQKSLNIRNKE
ncbi:MAG: 5-methylthioadenosine/S-adenosylhomocysteine deaminase [Halieaceae bacterium]|jgi:5-methylthioadenosine/S-adenosylhomocysteine deaminase